MILSVAHIRQSQDADCVAACAAMVLAYIGISTSYDQLLKLLQTKSFGTISSKIKLLEQLGIDVLYKQGTLDDIREHLANNHPPIAFVETGELPYWNRNTKHAVVVVGLDDEHIFLNDPAFPNSPIPVSIGDFDLAWLEFDELYAVLTRRS